MSEVVRKIKKSSLIDVAVGQCVMVMAIEGGKMLHDRLHALGIREGTVVSKVSESLGRGPVVLRHGANQTALGYKICQKIIVEEAICPVP